MEVHKPSNKCMGQEQKPRMSLILKDFDETKLTGLSCITCLKVEVLVRSHWKQDARWLTMTWFQSLWFIYKQTKTLSWPWHDGTGSYFCWHLKAGNLLVWLLCKCERFKMKTLRYYIWKLQAFSDQVEWHTTCSAILIMTFTFTFSHYVEAFIQSNL